MARKLKLDDDLDEIQEFTDEDADLGREEIPEIPAPRKATGTRKRTTYPKAVHREFDIRAAHQAWKEKNGIDDDYGW